MKTELLTKNDLINIMVVLEEKKIDLKDNIFKTYNQELKNQFIIILKTYEKLTDKIDIILEDE